MAKYLFIASYTPEGAAGVVDKGGVARREALEQMTAELGGTLDSFYFAFGADDAFVIADLPDNETAAAIGLRVGASGLASVRTVVLLTPEEIDRATGIDVTYRGPGT